MTYTMQECTENSHSFPYGIPKIGQPCACGQQRWYVDIEASLWKRLQFAWWSFRVQLYLAFHPIWPDDQA